MTRDNEYKVDYQSISKLIKKNEGKYIDSPEEMIAAFNRELETIGGYNGRQILELLQNCDDQESTKVLIKLNEEENFLSIYNFGKPFSYRGYRSLFISNLSPKKSKKRFIGNKGLGFRSIINWSNSIEIISNDISISFSENIRAKKFDELFDLEEKRNILNEFGDEINVKPIPFLNCVEINKRPSPKPYTTVIKINYKEEFTKNILEQIHSLQAESLFFLQHIQEIKFEGIEHLHQITCSKKELREKHNFHSIELLKMENEEWRIFKREGEINLTKKDLQNKKEFFELKIAISKNRTFRKNTLYSYFPTNIKLDLPFIIHGTFDLDSTRNHLNFTEKNKVVFKELVSLIVDVAIYESKNELSWFPLKMLIQDKAQSTRLDELGYFDQLSKAIIDENIWPCLDGKYRKLKEVVYFNESFSTFIQENNFSDFFPSMLISIDDASIENDFNIENTLETEYEVLNKIGSKITDLSIRAKFIKVICETYKNETKVEAELFVNKNNKTIKRSKTIYSPPDTEISIPKFCRIEFMHPDLYDALLIEFGLEESDNPNKSLKEELSCIIDFKPFDPLNVARKIIDATKNQVNKNTKDAKVKVMESIQALWKNYHKYDGLSDHERKAVPIINARGNISKVEDLILAVEYPEGKLGEKLFSQIYTEDDFVASPNLLNIEAEIDEFQEFILWLGVNKITKWKPVTFDSKKNEKWNSTVLKLINDETGESFDEYHYRLTYLSIHKLDTIIKRLSIEEIIIWLYNDDKLRELFLDQTDDDKFIYYPKTGKISTNKTERNVNYIYTFFLNKEINFGDYIIQLDSKLKWINKFPINFNHKIFRNSKLKKRDIENFLTVLGAKNDFMDLSTGNVSEIIKQLPILFPKGKFSKIIYKKAVEHFKENGQYLGDDILLFAQTDNNLQLFDPKKIFFSDTIRLPRKLQSKFPILNFPFRAGAAKAIDFFQIQDLKDISIEIESFEENKNQSQEFNQFLNKLKPYLFVYRLNSLEREEAKKNEAKKLDELRIVLCRKINVKVEEEMFAIQNYEYVSRQNENLYFVKTNGKESLKTLRKNSKFSDLFSEIISHHFRVQSNTQEFRSIFREDDSDVKYRISNHYGKETLDEANMLLNAIDHKQIFWKTIEKCLQKDEQSLANDSRVDKQVKKLMKDYKNLDYDILNNPSNFEALKNLFTDLSITITDYNRNTHDELNFSNYHKDRLEHFFLSQHNYFKNSLWKQLSESSRMNQKIFLELSNKFEDREEFITKEAVPDIFNLGYERIFKKFLSKIIPELTFQTVIFEDIERIKLENEKYFSAKELSLIKSDHQISSLMFFEGHADYIKEHLKLQEKELAQQGKEVEDDLKNGDLISPRKIESLSNKEYNLQEHQKEKTYRENKIYQPNLQSQERLKEIGDDNEKIVYNHLIKEYSKKYVEWVSRNNEGLHYDIRFSKNEGKNWTYVEVKTFSKGSFIISASQIKFGKKNKDNCEIWLINSKKEIKILGDFFKKEKLELEPKEFYVFVEFK